MTFINHWAYPEAFWLFLILPVGVGGYVYLFHPRRLRVHTSYSGEYFSEASTFQVIRSFLPHFFYVLALCMAVLGLARPQYVSRWESSEDKGWDIMCLIDVSRSMVEVEGRLSHVRTYLKALIDREESSRMGIILFGEEAFTFVPMTWDKGVLDEMIDRIQPGWVPAEGTSIGNAIALALHRLEASQAAAPYLLIFSDGGNNRSLIAPAQAAQLAHTRQVPLSACIWRPHPDSLHQVEQLGRDSLTWRELTAPYGGQTLFIPHLKPIDTMLSMLEESAGEGIERGFRRVQDRYPFFLFAAIVFLLISWGIRYSSWANPLEL